jgi:murein DD-endopeptidase MepM/ murein hydrolase activator NlpD
MIRAVSLVALSVLAVSCGASEAPGQPAQQLAQAQPAPRPAPVPAPAAIGQFKLNRAPQQGSVSLGWVPAGTKRLVANGQEVRIAPDGRFVVGFGRDHDASLVLAAFLADGRSVTERLVVAKRAWKIENLATVKRFSQPDAEFQARRPAELAQINAARRMGVQSEGWRQKLIWPSRGRISGFFGSQRIYAGEPGAPHSGVDVAAGQGAPVVAPADGVVTLAAAAPFTLEGNLLIVDHGMGLDSAFLHLSRIVVKRGDIVRQGQLIGFVGATGRASGPHLHWGMKWNQERIDPQPLAGPMVVPPAKPVGTP